MCTKALLKFLSKNSKVPTLHEERLGGRRRVVQKHGLYVISSLPHCVQQILEKNKLATVGAGVPAREEKGTVLTLK